MENQNTALTHVHESLGAKMVSFAGYNMPVQYKGVNIEHINVRENVGVFDVSHMGEFIVRGEGAFDLVQKITSNDVSKLIDGKVQYSCLPNGKGGIVDDLLVYRMNNNCYLLVVNASNIKKDWDWISMHNTDDLEIENIKESQLNTIKNINQPASLLKAGLFFGAIAIIGILLFTFSAAGISAEGEGNSSTNPPTDN